MATTYSDTGLPHFKNSRIADSNGIPYEPVFNAYFTVQITPPDALQLWDPLIINSVTKITGFDTSKAFPGVKEQSYKGAKRSYAGGKVPDQRQDLSLSFEVNLNDSYQMFTYNAIREWCNLVYNPATGKMGTRKKYTGHNVIISQYDADGNVFRQVTFTSCIPMSRVKGPDEFDFENDEIYRIDGWQLRCDDYDEIVR